MRRRRHPPPNDHLLDPLEAGTLFAAQGCPPEQALWIEIKLAAQHALVEGIARPNPSYSPILLTHAPRDIRRLAADPHITSAALLLIMHNADEQTAAHDLVATYKRSIEESLPVGAPFTERLPITDRLGNAITTAALFPVGH